MTRVDVQYLINKCREPGVSEQTKLIAWLAERELEVWSAEEELEDAIESHITDQQVRTFVGDWMPLKELREGAIFETKDGTRAVKSEYHYGDVPNHGCMCILLESGEYAHFGNTGAEAHNATIVREVILSGVSS